MLKQLPQYHWAMSSQPPVYVWRTRDDLRRMHGRMWAEEIIWQWHCRNDRDRCIKISKLGHLEFLVLEQAGELAYTLGNDNRLQEAVWF